MIHRQLYTIVNLTIVLFCLLGIVSLQGKIFPHQKEIFGTLEDNPLFVPDSNKLQYLTFGYDNLLTDIVWLKVVQYIGGNARTSDYPLLFEYLDSITNLDGRFYMPYFVAQLLLPEIERAEEAIEISNKGLKELPERWEIPYYLAYIYYYYVEDYEKGAAMYQHASEIPGVLDSAKKMAINLTSKANKHAVALEMWIEAYEEEENPDAKELIAQKIQREKNFLDLEKAVRDYRSQYGFLPDNLDKLIEEGFLPQLPIDPITPWMEYVLDEAGVVVLQKPM